MICRRSANRRRQAFGSSEAEWTNHTGLDILQSMRSVPKGFVASKSKPAIQKPVSFEGSSLKDLRDFPKGAKEDCGYQLEKVQLGEQPDDFKPMPAIGPGVEEIRVKEVDGIYRVIYVARYEESVYVLHAFQKKTEQTPAKDIELARERFKNVTARRAVAAKQRKGSQ
jgi:phage-related protein